MHAVTLAIGRVVALALALASCGKAPFRDIEEGEPLAPDRVYAGAVTLFVPPSALVLSDEAAAALASAALDHDLGLLAGGLPIGAVSEPIHVGEAGPLLTLRLLSVRLSPWASGGSPRLSLSLGVLPRRAPVQTPSGACEAVFPGSVVEATLPLTLGRDIQGRILVSPDATGLLLSTVEGYFLGCAGGLKETALGAAVQAAAVKALASDVAFLGAAGRVARRLLGADLPSRVTQTFPDGATIDAALLASADDGQDPVIVDSTGIAIIPMSLAIRLTESPCMDRWAPPLPAQAFQQAPSDYGTDLTLALRRDAVEGLVAAAIATGALCATEPVPLGRADSLAGLVDRGSLPPETPLMARLLPRSTPVVTFAAGGQVGITLPSVVVQVYARIGDFDRLLVEATETASLVGLSPSIDATHSLRLVLAAPAATLAGRVLSAVLGRAPVLVLPDRLAFPIASATLTLSDSHWLVHLALDTSARPVGAESGALLARPESPSCAAGGRPDALGLGLLLALAAASLTRRRGAGASR